MIVTLPAAMAAGANYGLNVPDGPDNAQEEALARRILSRAGPAVLERYGFVRP